MVKLKTPFLGTPREKEVERAVKTNENRIKIINNMGRIWMKPQEFVEGLCYVGLNGSRRRLRSSRRSRALSPDAESHVWLFPLHAHWLATYQVCLSLQSLLLIPQVIPHSNSHNRAASSQADSLLKKMSLTACCIRVISFLTLFRTIILSMFNFSLFLSTYLLRAFSFSLS